MRQFNKAFTTKITKVTTVPDEGMESIRNSSLSFVSIVTFVVKSFTGCSHRAVILGLALGCNPATSAQNVEQLPRDGATYWPSAAEWRRAEPAQVGLDAQRLAALVQSIHTNTIPGLHSLVVVRHGYVAVE